MVQHISDGGTSPVVGIQHHGDEVPAAWSQLLWLRIVTGLNVLGEERYVAVVKRHTGSQHCVEDHSHAPDVALWSAVRTGKDHLGSSIEGAATEGSLLEAGVGFLGESKVNQLERREKKEVGHQHVFCNQ